jgi:molybdopterin molybdotransferase
LLESLGRVLAEPLAADRNQPPFPRSTRDGFACHAADLIPGHKLKVIGQLRAGETWPAATEIAEGEAVEIMTGAPVPADADCVVMLEHVRQEGDEVSLEGHERVILAGANIVPGGAEARQGQVILSSGTVISAAQIAMAAACGAAELSVFCRPRVAIAATGDELVELDQQPLPHQIRNSNSYSLAAQLLLAGAEPVRLAIARDDAQQLQTLIRAGLEADLLLLSGGVSMGKYDLVEEVLLSLGAEFFFTGALIQPGKPIVFGRFGPPDRPKYFFGLPGNPVSTMVTFSLFVEPLLGVIGGRPFSGPLFARAKLKRELQVKTGLTRFLPAVLGSSPEDSPIEPTVEVISWQGSGDIAGASRANCFLVVPSGRPTLSAGETVTLLL